MASVLTDRDCRWRLSRPADLPVHSLEWIVSKDEHDPAKRKPARKNSCPMSRLPDSPKNSRVRRHSKSHHSTRLCRGKGSASENARSGSAVASASGPPRLIPEKRSPGQTSPIYCRARRLVLPTQNLMHFQKNRKSLVIGRATLSQKPTLAGQRIPVPMVHRFEVQLTLRHIDSHGAGP